MYTKTPSLKQPTPKTIIFTGGSHESLSNLEMKPGECLEIVNYEEVSGETHGYRSTAGFEKIDGTTETITDPNDSESTLDVTYPSTVPLVYNDSTDFSDVDDTAREARRSDILGAPITGAGYLKAAFEFNDDFFVITYEGITGDHTLYRMADNSGAGWVAVSSFPTISEGAVTDAGYNYHVSIGRMQLYPLVADSATPNTDIAVLCNGITAPILMYFDDSGDYYCEYLLESSGPEYDSSLYTPRLPSDSSIGTGYPLKSIIYNQRLHLAFPGGALFVSHVGDPFFFDNALKSAGVWWLGSEVTDFEIAPSSLVVFMENGIDIIRPSDPDLTTGFDESKETFSPSAGAYANTAQRILGRTMYCGKRGITSLETTGAWGDFQVSTMSKRVQKTYEKYKETIIGTAVDRTKNQYIVYFSSGVGIVLTVEPNFRGDFTVRGATTFNLSAGLTNLNTVWGLRDESKRLLTSSTDTYLRLQHKDAQSFDGSEITSRFTSAFHGYGSAASWKNFQRLLFELVASKGQVFSVRPLYDYSSPSTPKSSQFDSDPQPAGSEWGEGEWGDFTWGGTGAINQEYSYISGVGFNMGIQFSCTTKYHNPHVVQNAIVLYTIGAQKF